MEGRGGEGCGAGGVDDGTGSMHRQRHPAERREGTVPVPLGDAAPSGRYDPQTAEVSVETPRNGIISEAADARKRPRGMKKRGNVRRTGK